jgi:hypothetical protein
MSQKIETVVVKKMSDAQFGWAFRRGFIWQIGGEGSNFFVSKKYQYFWVPIFVNKNGEDDGGYWEVSETRRVAA